MNFQSNVYLAYVCLWFYRSYTISFQITHVQVKKMVSGFGWTNDT